MSDSQLVRASSVMAVGTIASRVTGLIRNLLVNCSFCPTNC
jgi:putative peptidoglycan lipid II flippase